MEPALTSERSRVHDTMDQNIVSPDQMAKIKRDLDVVQSNMAVFSEMLGEMKPGSENASDVELLEELYTTCKEMQRRIAELLCSISSDELTADMLHINDELNNLFLRFERYKKNQEKNQRQMRQEPSLIDFGSEGAVTNKISGLSLNSKQSDDADFDSFAQSRNEQPSKPAAVPAAGKGDSLEEEILMGHKPSDFDEMEAWLKENPTGAAGGGGGSESTLTSSEFDKFLAGRAAAAANNSGNTSSSSAGGGRGGGGASSNSKVPL